MKKFKFLAVVVLFLVGLKIFAQVPNQAQMPSQNPQIPVQDPQIPGETAEPNMPSTTPVLATPPQPEAVNAKTLSPDLTSPSFGLSKRDPFRIPEYLLIKIRQQQAVTGAPTVVSIDDNVEATRRWPLATYKLVGIIWDVKKPKAMFIDEKNSIHLMKVNDFIGNAKGVITNIKNGSVTVQEGKIPQVIKLNK